MTGNTSLDVVTEKISQLTDSMLRMEKDIEKMSSSVVQIAEFRKEAQFLNEKVAKMESSRNHMLNELKELQLAVNSQKTINRIFQVGVSIGCSFALAIGIYIAGANKTSEVQMASIERDVNLLKYQVTQKLSSPNVQVNQNDPNSKN